MKMISSNFAGFGLGQATIPPGHMSVFGKLSPYRLKTFRVRIEGEQRNTDISHFLVHYLNLNGELHSCRRVNAPAVNNTYFEQPLEPEDLVEIRVENTHEKSRAIVIMLAGPIG